MKGPGLLQHIEHPLLGTLKPTDDEYRRLARLEKLQKEYEPFRQAPQLMAAPHPVRLAASPMARSDTVVLTCAEPRHQDKVRELMRSGVGNVALLDLLHSWGDRRIGRFLTMYEGATVIDGGFGGGVAGAVMQGALYEVAGGTLYSLSDDLVEMLDSTELGDMPLEALELPVPNLYVQLGINRARARHHLYNPVSGQHALEGAYLSKVRHPDGRVFLEVTLTGSPIGKSDLLDDAVEWASLEVTPGLTVTDAIVEAYMKSVRGDDPATVAATQEALKSRAISRVSMLELVIKAVLFLQTSDARTTRSDAGTQARQALARAVSGAHRRKAVRASAFSYDCIMVEGPEPLTEEERAARDSGGPRSAHFRSGHFRHQRHGPGFSLTKVLWIRPTFVNPATRAAL